MKEYTVESIAIAVDISTTVSGEKRVSRLFLSPEQFSNLKIGSVMKIAGFDQVNEETKG